MLTMGLPFWIYLGGFWWCLRARLSSQILARWRYLFVCVCCVFLLFFNFISMGLCGREQMVNTRFWRLPA